jgi:hypothetical protein
VFGVSSGKLLSYMVSSRGIDANPKIGTTPLSSNSVKTA